MNILYREVREWHSTALGGYLLWSFTKGYIDAHADGDAPNCLLHFLAMPLLANQSYHDYISDRRENLQSFVRAFETEKQIDQLLNIQTEIKSRQQYTLESLNIAIANGLLLWDTKSGKIYSTLHDVQPQRGAQLRPSTRRLGAKAKILGRWFSAHSIQDIATYLKVLL